MNDKLKNPLFYAGILGGIKLILTAFGVDVITDDQINSIANGFASIFTVIGVGVSWSKDNKNIKQE